MVSGHTLVIGGNKGLGRAFVNLIAGNGADVSVIGRHSSANLFPDNRCVHCRSADILDLKRISKVLRDAIKQYGKLSSLVFFQRYRGGGDAWDGEMRTSLSATRNIIEILKGDFEKENASIVLVSSVNERLITPSLPLSYHLAKAGLVQIARYYAAQLGREGIRVNSVSPGTVLKDESKDFYLKNKKLLQLYEKMSPLGRMGTADEAARVIAFLCGRDASYITGQNIIVDGGLSLEWQESLARRLARV